MNNDKGNKMTLYPELDEIINMWKKYLTEIRIKLQCSIKTILEEIIGNDNIFATFFEYEYDVMDILFFAIDKNENEIIFKKDILNEKLNSKILFPVDLYEKQNEVMAKYDGEDDDFDNIYNKYDQEKTDIFEKWFKSCWDEAIKGYNNVPNSFFSIHDTNYKLNLKTNEEIKYCEILNK
jgi:hypothetical protein